MTSPTPEPVGSQDSLTLGSAFAPLVSLAGIAAVACWVDVLLGRGLMRVIGATVERETALVLEQASRYVQNVAALLCLFGLVSVTRTTLRNVGVSFGVLRRVAIGGLLGILMPTICIAVFLPEPSTTVLLVLVGFTAGHGLVIAYGSSAFMEEAPVEQRVACALALAMAVASLGELFAEYFMTESVSLQHDLRNVSELVFFALPVAVGLGVLVRGGAGLSRGNVLLTAALGASVVGLLRVAASSDASMQVLLYGTLRLSALEAAPPIVYALLIGASLVAALLVASAKTPIDRRLGFGLLLVLAAGAGPRSPGTIASLVLGAALLGLVSTPSAEAHFVSTRSHSAS